MRGKQVLTRREEFKRAAARALRYNKPKAR
jgi:hypothetical protein